jgi:hypothetical protein
MKPTSVNSQIESADPLWPSVLRIKGDEFQQSFAVAQLAVKLCEIKIARSKVPLEKENLTPEKFLAEAWKLIESAREHLLRPQTDVEYLAEQGGNKGALTEVFNRRFETVPFQKLCDPKRNKGDSETLDGIEWKVYLSERTFDDLFWKYWHHIGERWKRGDQEIGTVRELETKGKPRKNNFYSESERKRLAARTRNTDAWKRRGKLLLNSWKRNGVPLADFLALARFRRERDNRAENLKKKPKRKRWQQLKARQPGARARMGDCVEL